MKKRPPFPILLFLFAAVLTACGGQSQNQPRVVRGNLDLSARDFHASGPLSLKGDWEFHWRRFIKPGSPAASAGHLKVPRNWIGFRTASGETAGGTGYGSYRVRIKLPAELRGRYLGLRLPVAGTSYRLLVNGRELATQGRPGERAETSKPAYGKKLAFFEVKDTRLEIIFHVANFSHRSGGLWFNIEMGLPEQMRESRELALFLDFFLFGSLLIMGLYHIGLFLNRREDIASVLFGTFSLIIAVRILFTGEYFIYNLFPNLPWAAGIRVEYMTHIVGAPLFLSFVAVLFAERYRKPAIVSIWIISGLFALHTLLFSPAAFSAALAYWEIILLLVGVYGLVITTLAVFHGREGAAAALLGGLVFSASVVNDILHARAVIQTAFLAPLGLFLFFFAQSYMLSRIFSGAFRSVVNLTRNLKQLNTAYSRFVPLEFLKLLGKSDVREIRLGDQVARDMTVLFADIRSFTSLSESMTPAENFNFLNSYLKRMGPIVQSHNGYIDKYIGDSIMALFPDRPDDALNAALAMQSELENYNSNRAERNLQTIRVGMGIHTGHLMLGTIGDVDRMDGTVISDAVNLASRMEELTKFYRAPILLSEESRSALAAPGDYALRTLDRVRVRGKREYVLVHELCVTTRPRAEFERGVQAFHKGDYTECRRLMKEIVTADPGDETAALYIERCDQAEVKNKGA